MELSIADGVIFFIIFAFAFLAFLKGFIKDLFSTFNLILATVASYALSPMLCDLLPDTKYPQMLVDLGVRVAVFVSILILSSVITSKISKPLNEGISTPINQSLGFGFGFAKGYFILAFVFSAFLSIYAKGSYQKIGPEWFQTSKSYDLLLVGADLLQPFTNDFVAQIKGDTIGQIGEKGELLKSAPGAIGTIMKNKELYEHVEKYGEIPDEDKNEEVDENSGYTDNEMDKLKRLIEIVK
jgi:membrane protein required for colicin V production